MERVVVINCATGEIVERDMTPDERARRAIDVAEGLRQVAAQDARAAMRLADLRTVRAAARDDPRFAALARLLDLGDE